MKQVYKLTKTCPQKGFMNKVENEKIMKIKENIRKMRK